jgi:hypothetical protein
MDAQSAILKRRGTTVDEWIRLGNGERPLRGCVEQGILKSRSEIRVEPFDYNPQSVQPDLATLSERGLRMLQRSL